MYSNYFVILYGTTQQWAQLIICILDHLWYASGKDQTNLFFSLLFFIFGPGLSASRTPFV